MPAALTTIAISVFFSILPPLPNRWAEKSLGAEASLPLQALSAQIVLGSQSKRVQEEAAARPMRCVHVHTCARQKGSKIHSCKPVCYHSFGRVQSGSTEEIASWKILSLSNAPWSLASLHLCIIFWEGGRKGEPQ